MRHSNFYRMYEEIDRMVESELVNAVNAHGGEYVFIHPEGHSGYDGEADEKSDAPIILASQKNAETTEDCYVSRVTVMDGSLMVYGFPTGCYSTEDEDYFDYIPHGQLMWVIDMIPEVEEVKGH